MTNEELHNFRKEIDRLIQKAQEISVGRTRLFGKISEMRAGEQVIISLMNAKCGLARC